MISLHEIAKKIDVMKENKVKFKDKDGKDHEIDIDTAKQYKQDIDGGDDSDYKKTAVKAAGLDKDDKDSEQPSGKALGGSDFERDFDDKGEEPKGEPESGDEPKKLSSDEIDKKVKDLGDEIRNIYQSGMSPQDSERYIDGLQKQIDDLKSQKGGDDNAESDDIEISDANSGPIDRDDIMDMLKNDSEVVDKMGDDVYWDGVDLVSSKFDDDTIASVDGNMSLGDLKKQIMDYEEMSETIKVDLKAKYDEIFRSLK